MSEIPVIPTDSFEAFRDLLAILARPPKTTRLLNELERRMADVKAGEAKLAERTARHDEKVARDLASIEEKSAKLNARALELTRREHLAEQTLEREKTAFQNRYPPLSGAGTLTREPG
jgi:hypothetical protein